jgi:hypothetical protein
MKDIKDMNLAEAIEALRDVDVITRAYQCNYDAIEELADRIHELTRWIPVSERMPTEEDGYKGKYVTQRTVLVMEKWGDISVVTIGLAKHFTHWKRITPPETP